MSTSDVLTPIESASPNKQFVDTLEKKGSPVVPNEDLPLTKGNKEVEDDEKPAMEVEDKPKIIYTYTKEELLKLRSAEGSLKKPDVLQEDFFRSGIWDPEAWHKSSSSRSASPIVIDGKPVVSDGKKLEILHEGDDIELAPRRQSFKQGCQVKASQSNGTVRPTVDRKSRLTGRAANQRRPLEPNYKDSDSISERTHEFEKMRKEQYDRKEKDIPYKQEDRYYDKDRGNHYNDRNDRSNAFSKNRDKGYDNGRDLRGPRNNHSNNYNEYSRKEETLPEWMTDGPTSQLDTIELIGFNKDMEEEKKAFAAKKKKKVRISPDVETREIIKASQPVKRKTPSPKLEKQTSQKQSKDSDKSNSKAGFDINDFFQEVDYYPPKMFHEDVTQGDGVKSRFTQWFQTQQQQNPGIQNKSLTRQSTESLLPNEVFTGGPKLSPVPQQSYFTPIQPAPALLSAAANAHAVQTSNIANIIHKQKINQLEENLKKANKEVRGRLNVEELEGVASKPAPGVMAATQQPIVPDKSAFNMFLKTMKAAGQLPEKPSPVVSGLPSHLLPHPPTRTSPTFEKLKRSLSRSPSPKEFVKAVSTVANILSSNPTIDRELALLQKKTTTTTAGGMSMSNDLVSSSDHQVLRPDSVQTPKTSSSVSHLQMESFSSPSVSSKKAPRNAFTPTSVLKKMHSERKEDCASPLLTQDKNKNPDVSMVSVRSNGTYPDLLPEKVRGGKVATSSHVEKNLNKQFYDAVATPDRLGNMMPFHSAPATPMNQFNNTTTTTNTISASAPGTPDRRINHMDPPSINRLPVQPSGLHGSGFDSAFDSINITTDGGKTDPILLAPSAFQSIDRSSQKSNIGVIGSGIPQKSSDPFTSFVEKLGQMNVNDRASPRQLSADPKLAPGNGASLRQSRPLGSPGVSGPLPLNPLQHFSNQQQSSVGGFTQPQSQQQQLLQAQRLAQIQQAQLLQQQKLREIAKQANQANQQDKPYQGTNSVRPLLPDPEKPHQNQQKRRPLYQQSQHQQLLAYQQQQQQQQQQMLAQHQRSQLRGPPSLPFPPTQMRAPGQHRPQLPMPQGMPPFQQSQGNPGFSNVNMAAQALVQQQLFNQAARARLLAHAQLLQQQPQVVQAALMAQAALVRGQAQAQAAMMLNPRNLQAMAEQMGMRPPFNPNNKQMPPPNSNPNSGMNATSNSADQGGSNGNVLSKWFSNDVLQKIPPTKGGSSPSELSSAKMMSVEELERK